MHKHTPKAGPDLGGTMVVTSVAVCVTVPHWVATVCMTVPYWNVTVCATVPHWVVTVCMTVPSWVVTVCATVPHWVVTRELSTAPMAFIMRAAMLLARTGTQAHIHMRAPDTIKSQHTSVCACRSKHPPGKLETLSRLAHTLKNEQTSTTLVPGILQAFLLCLTIFILTA